MSSHNRHRVVGTDKEVRVHVVLMGGDTVGKTSLAHRVTRNAFPEICEATIGDYKRRSRPLSTTQLKIGDGVIYCDVWDTAGHGRFNYCSKMYLKRADAAVLVYDVTMPSTFDSIQWWMDTIMKEKHVPKVVIKGNKCDLQSAIDDQGLW